MPRWLALLPLAALLACAGPQKVTFNDLASDVQLTSLPIGCQISVDGQSLGKTPTVYGFESGKTYQITFTMKGFAPGTIEATREDLLKSGSGQVGVVLLPLGATLPPRSSLDKPNTLTALAGELERRKDWAHAAEFWTRVIQLSPRDARAHRGMGSALAKMGRDEEAIREYEQYLFLAPPDAEDAERVRRAVDSYRGGVSIPAGQQR
jgi:tetratricopeptide (TPR) repeat protein